MLTAALLVIGILGIVWLETGLIIAVRYRTSVDLPKLALCFAIVLFVFLASIATHYNGW